MNDTALPPLDTLIHLGAGRCQELDIHLAQQPAHLVLVEADPDLAEALRARTAQWPQVKVIEAAIAAESGPVTLQRYNLAAANSLRPATGLLAIYPGLKSQPALSLEAVTAASIFGTCALETDGRHLLVVDLPGEELAVLQSALASGYLDGFSELQVYCGHEPLYDGSATAKTLIAWLSEQGFDLIAQRDEEQPYRPCWLFKRNPLVLALKVSRVEADRQAKLAAERAEQLEQRARADEQGQARVQELSKALEAARAEFKRQSESTAQYKAEAEKQAKAAEQAKAEAEKQTLEVAQAKAEAEKQAKAAEQAKAEADKQARQAAQHKAEAEKQAKATEQAKAEADKQAKAAEQAKAEADRQAKLAAERAEQLEHSQQAQAALQRDNALALRLQQLRETDLKDLQQRYAQVVEQKAQQERLLKQLTERLTAASAYLHQLEQQANDHPPQLTEKAGKPDKHNKSNRSTKPNKPNKKRRA